MTTHHFSMRKRSAWLMVLLILAAAWLRLWRFPDIPPAFNYDEAYNVVDALWLWETGSPLVYLPGNTGRHALFHHLAAPFLVLLGVNTFAFRFVSVVISILVIPLMYRWVAVMFAQERERRYLGLIAAGGLAFSFWHITLSRSGFRASLLLLLFVLMVYLFWLGWQRQSSWHIAGAGIVLGLCQYTYWLAGLLPLQFGLFALIWTIRSFRKKQPLTDFYRIYSIKRIWLWIGLMAVASFLVFIPLGLAYLKDPTALGYVSQSSIAGKIASGERSWFGHLLTSLRIFLDGPVGLWQGRLNQSLSFDWLALIGFWLGLVVSIRRRRRPPYLFLLASLLVLWLPAPLNDIDFSDLRLPDMLPVNHAISNLRLAGVLPVYYTVVAVGLLAAVQWLGQKLSWPLHKPSLAGLIAFGLIVIISGSLNAYNFFVRWPRQPYLYERYNGPVFELAQNLVRESQRRDILIPFHLFAHPTMHLFFDRIFIETDTPPLETSHDSAILVVAEGSPRSAYMWLVRPATGPGLAYLTPPQDAAELSRLSAGQPTRVYNLAAPLMITARTSLISNLTPLRPQLSDWPPFPRLGYNWNNEVGLAGYEISPGRIKAGQSLDLTLYWQNLVDQPLTHDVFIHVINSRGEGVGQVDGVELTNGHRWRAGRLAPTHHVLQIPGDLSPGPYLFRMGLFNARTGSRIPVFDAQGRQATDQIIFGLFYVTANPQIPIEPETPVRATLGEQIQLLGYTLPHAASEPLAIPPEGEMILNLTLYWQASQPVNNDYTIFVQLLDSQNQRVAGHDTQPLHGSYPTSRWQPQDVITEKIDLPLPPGLPPGSYTLVAGMYDFNTGQRLPAADSQGQPLADDMIPLGNVRISSDAISFSPTP